MINFQKKLIGKVIRFYSAVENTYVPHSGTNYANYANQDKEQVCKAADIINLLLLRSGEKQSYINDLYNRVADMYDNFYRYQEYAKADLKFSEQLERIRRETGLDLKCLSEDSDIVLLRIENLGTKKTKEQEENYFPAKGSDWAWTAVYILGPIGIAVKAVYEIAKGIHKIVTSIWRFFQSRKS